ncbi:MAG: ribulose-phosphate 3-epimerase [Spirochaetota bacterium]
MKISASILATSITRFSTMLPTLKKEEIDYLHIDVMDGNFVPQISFGESITKEIRGQSDIPLDVHLMVENPEQEVPKYYDLQPDFITFHAEATDFMVRLCEDIRVHGSKAGIALNPATSLESVRYILPYIDLLLVMTVDPGFYGQKFTLSGMQKIQDAKKMIDASGYDIALEVDGGVNVNNIAQVSQSGASICVAGSAVFKNGVPGENTIQLKKLTETA